MPWGLIGGAVVIIGGAGGAYAWLPNQKQETRQAVAAQAASRRQRWDDHCRVERQGCQFSCPRSCRTHRALNQAESTHQLQNKRSEASSLRRREEPVQRKYHRHAESLQPPHGRKVAGTSATTAGSCGFHGGGADGTGPQPRCSAAGSVTETGAAAMTGTTQPLRRHRHAERFRIRCRLSAQANGQDPGKEALRGSGAASRDSLGVDGTMPTAGGSTSGPPDAISAWVTASCRRCAKANPASGSPMSSAQRQPGEQKHRSASVKAPLRLPSPRARPLARHPLPQSSTQERARSATSQAVYPHAAPQVGMTEA